MIRLISLLMLVSCGGMQVKCVDGDEVLCKPQVGCQTIQRQAIMCSGSVY
jgi:hypothetical protein